MYMKTYKPRRKSYRKKTTTKSYKKCVTASHVKTLIKSQLSRQIENKYRDVLNMGRVLVSPTNTSYFDDNNVITVSPASVDGVVPSLSILQGTTGSSRIGDRIKIRNLYFRGTLTPLGYQSTTNPTCKPLQVKMFLFYNKQTPTSKPMVQASSDFFRFNNTTQIINDDLASMWAPVNDDKYRVVYTRMFKLGLANTLLNSSGTLGPVNYVNNDFKYNCNFKVDVAKYLPKVVRYNDNNSDPTSRGLYAMFVPVAADGTGLGASAQIASITYSLECIYEDA